ncbi:unnamed protein product [Durusdinium trenchii]|uniref:Uncharacterized protein n=1 Tax=Durusdinium trenchii TaxID=1381693 RepID=A0ABP0JNR8_9DINO
MPGNLMETIAGQFHFKVSQPQTMDEANHRAASIRRAATEAYQWLEANEPEEGSRLKSTAAEDGTVGGGHAGHVTKEALQQLADQLKKGRVNAELIPTHEEAANRGEEQARAALPAQAPAPDPRYPAMTLSDDEQQPSDDDIGPEELKKATSEEGRSWRRESFDSEEVVANKLEESSIRATVASSSAVDPAMQTVRQKRDFYETAFRTTQEHLKKMKTKLEKKSALMMEPVAPATVVDRSEACENGESEEATGSEPVYSPYTSEESNQTVASISLPFIEVDMFEEPWPGEGDLIDDPAFRVMDHEAYVTDMASECQPLQHEHDVLPAGWRADGFRRVGILRNPSPCTRAKVPADRWRLLGDVPSRLRRPLTQTEVLEAYRKGQLSTGQTRPAVARPGLHEDDDRGRVHLTPRRRMFVPGIVPDEDHLQDGEPLPDAVPGLQGLRATQVGYQTPLGAKEYVRDNIHWKSWNASLDMNRSWRGITRFVTLDPATDYLVLATWMQGRQAVEELWRHGARANQAYKSVIKEVNVAELGQGMPLESEHHTQMMMTVLGYFAPFAAATALPLPAPPSAQGGLLELAELDSNVLQDVDKPETGKVKLWATLAVHVDDVRFICSPVAEVELWPKLKGLFTFGDWVHPEEFTKFCGRWERQLPDGTVELQMNEYARKVKDPPSRSASRAMAPLMPNEKSWIGAIIGQLNWLARQARADLLYGCSRIQQLSGTNDPAALQELKVLVERAREPHTQVFKKLGCGMDQMRTVPGRISFDGGKSPGVLKRVVRSSLAAEISQAATTMEEADYLRAFMGEALDGAFTLRGWLAAVAKWRQLSVLDSRTGYDLLNGSALGEDKRLAIDVAAMRQALQEDGASRMVRWVPGEEIIADDLTKLAGNGRLMKVMAMGSWALKDTEAAKKLRSDAAARKRAFRQRRASAPKGAGVL